MMIEDVKPGQRVRMVNLRRGTVENVTVHEVTGNKVMVDDDRGNRFGVGSGFLSEVSS